MIEVDLFGEVPPGNPKLPSTAGRPKGYAALPGTGPAEETCGSCAHIARMHQSKSWCKCRLMQPRWTHGRATDILSRSPACEKWQQDDSTAEHAK